MKFRPVVETETGWSDWIFPTPHRPYRMKCCDCGLVHDLEFEAIEAEHKRGGWTRLKAVLDRATYGVMFRARRNNRVTANERAKDSAEGA